MLPAPTTVCVIAASSNPFPPWCIPIQGRLGAVRKWSQRDNCPHCPAERVACKGDLNSSPSCSCLSLTVQPCRQYMSTWLFGAWCSSHLHWCKSGVTPLISVEWPWCKAGVSGESDFWVCAWSEGDHWPMQCTDSRQLHHIKSIACEHRKWSQLQWAIKAGELEKQHH